MVHETVEAKSEIILPLEKGDAKIVNRFGMHGISSASACIRSGRHVKHKIQRVEKWIPPPTSFLKINTDGPPGVIQVRLGLVGLVGILLDQWSLFS